jgi:long-chain acyl-CoA synthetase
MTLNSAVTVPALLCRCAHEHGERTAIWIHDGERFAPRTWDAIAEDAAQLAAVLRQLGVAPGERVATIVENRYAWVLADLAILLIRGVHVPIHTTLSGDQMAHQIVHSESRLTLLAGQQQAQALAPRAAELRSTSKFIALDDWKRRAKHALAPGLLAERIAAVDSPPDIAALAAEVREDELATIMYTSGTTGEPKGVMLSHANLASNAIATADSVGQTDKDLRLCFLPLSHVYARTCDLYTWIYRASELAIARSRETILEDMQLVRPTLLNGVPYFYEKVVRGLRAAGKDDRPGVLAGMLGGQVRFCFCGGAALPDHIESYFDEQNVPILAGYGLSETSPVIAASGEHAYKPGCVGRAIHGVEVRISDDGEILTRGPHVMQGYWKDAEATEQILRDGWLHTGDLGELDEDGFLRITGRKKELIVTSAGKNIVPGHLEGLLSQSPLILQVVVFGEGRSYLTALIVPDADAFKAAMREHKVRVFSKRGALAHPRMHELYRQEIDRLLAGVSKHEQIGRFHLLGQGFSPESGEMTSKASLRREVIAENYAKEIEALYGA